MRKALIIGINDYPNSPLTGCIKDAEKMAEVLLKNQDNSPNFDVKLITSDTTTIDRSFLRGAIEDLFSGDCDVAFLYFSGHGFIKSTGGYLVTIDAKKHDEGVSLNDILIVANRSKIKERVIILDSCYSGALGALPTIVDEHTSILSEGLSIMTACQSQETAFEKNGGGVFTSLLYDGLKGGAADLRGFITPANLYSYVDQALGPWNQRPIFKTNITKFTSIRKVNPPVSINVLRKLPEFFPDVDTKYNLNPSFEFTHISAIRKNVEIFQDLQRLSRVGIIVPDGEEFMYFAALNSKSCSLTALGHHYWRLAKQNKL
jgi:hypothetical protein